MLSTYEKAADAKNYILFERYGGKTPSAVRVPPHFHNSIEIAFITSGECSLRINGEERVLKAGDAAFMKSFDLHDYFTTCGCEYYAVLISSDYFDGINELRHLSFSPYLEKRDGSSEIFAFLDYAKTLWDSDDRLFASGFVNILLSLMKRVYSADLSLSDNARHGEVIAEALAYVDENSDKPLPLSSIAKRFGYSPNYFSTLFSETVGIGFNDYLNKCRLIHYERMIKESPETPTYKAALLCGFGSTRAFYRTLKKYGK